MRQARLPLFLQQQAHFALRFTCEHCSYFDVERERCTHGYPTAEHRSAGNAAGSSGELVFCKEFELR